ncbi:hypothetical protein HDU85_003414 [Gaertneriomyces sp. JEL0708]|nr:hypothetical protein HDU85_003414 [Gaertneriomyces sp. JEL0708]
MTLRDSAAEDRLRTRAATGVEVEYSGIKSVQKRLLSLGLVLCVIYTSYFAFFQTDLLVLSKSVTPKTISEADARDTPLQSFLVCLVENYLEDSTKSYDVLRDICEQQLKQSGEISFPSSAYRLIVESLISIAGVLATAAVSHLLITDWKKYLRTKGWLYSDSPIGRVVSVVRRRRNTHNSSNRSRDPYGAAADYGIPLSATLPLSSSPPSASTFRSYDGLLPRVYTSGGLHTPSPPSALSAYDEIKFNRFSPLQVSSPETSIPTGISRTSQSPRGSRDRSRSDSGGTLGLARRAEASLTLDPRDIMRPLPPPPRSPPPVLTPITASLSDAAALAQSFRTIDSTPDHPSVVVNSVVEREVYGGSFKPW